ncbi:LOW QUALITY PROTEIN: hypothetical protein SC1083_0073 [Aggregatibacter actinomycetemcomitans serotype e str. SC1083]|uniref:Uncharacterized protein n=1 Tax=Aggregatibacter actinomycetemcomitans serotype e str. SC1083 TaxID=907488 RepID=G4A5I8_AGGAC|nr:LOW QUALITY PROTEIN: hypothetical protein SC1083_0073 [Aggregatibacter actinomycetemcomitans serotype e str. SC1083]
MFEYLPVFDNASPCFPPFRPNIYDIVANFRYNTDNFLILKSL